MEITTENYYSKEANAAYLGSTQVKRHMECPASWNAERNGDYTPAKPTAFLAGGYVDTKYLTPWDFESWCEDPENAGIWKKGRKDKPEMLKSFLDLDRLVEVLEDFYPLDRLAEFNDIDRQAIYIGKIVGVPIKIRLDLINHTELVITDLKTTKDYDPIWDPELKAKVTATEKYNYWLQMAIYREIVRQNTGKTYACEILYINKTGVPHPKTVVFEDAPGWQQRYEYELAQASGSLVQMWSGTSFKPCKKTTCGYCQGQYLKARQLSREPAENLHNG